MKVCILSLMVLSVSYAMPSIIRDDDIILPSMERISKRSLNNSPVITPLLTSSGNPMDRVVKREAVREEDKFVADQFLHSEDNKATAHPNIIKRLVKRSDFGIFSDMNGFFSRRLQDGFDRGIN